jgi:hypothetical protein
MEKSERAEIERRLGIDSELTQLWVEHLELERQIEALRTRPYLSEPESTRHTLLKKRKLAGKDRIAAILAQPAPR